MSPYPAHDGTPPAVSSPPAKLRQVGIPQGGSGRPGSVTIKRAPRPFDRINTRTNPKNKRRGVGPYGGLSGRRPPLFDPGKQPVRPAPVFDPGKQPATPASSTDPNTWGY
jgi:hypothetical protein